MHFNLATPLSFYGEGGLAVVTPDSAHGLSDHKVHPICPTTKQIRAIPDWHLATNIPLTFTLKVVAGVVLVITASRKAARGTLSLITQVRP